MKKTESQKMERMRLKDLFFYAILPENAAGSADR